jgi:hypothetical protein
MCLIFSFTEKMHFYLTASLFALLTNNIIANHDDSQNNLRKVATPNNLKFWEQ